MSNCSREKTNSITHLVKIVAKEVVEELLQGRENVQASMEKEIKSLRRKVNFLQYCLQDEVPSIEDCPEEWKKDNAGAFWDRNQEDDLLCDMKLAVKWMASRHRRTPGAIEARLSQLRREGRLVL